MNKVKMPIGFKIVSMMSLMLIASTFLVVLMATRLFKDDATSFIYNTNHDVAAQLGDQTHEYFNLLVGVLTTMTEIQEEKLDSNRKAYNLHQQFSRNEEIQAVATWARNSNKPTVENDKTSDPLIHDFMTSLKPSSRAWAGEIDIQQANVHGQSLVAVSFPLSVDSSHKVLSACVGLVNHSKFMKIFGKGGVVTSYLVDREGNVLAHPKESLANGGANLKEVPIVKEMLTSTENNKFVKFKDQDGKAYLGAFRMVGVAGTGVVSQVLEEVAFAAAKKVLTRSILAAGMILFLGFGIAYFFSTTLTKPVKALMQLTQEIAKGNFKIKVHAKGHDEITQLTKSFGQMAEGLAERDKLKETFNKFHSKEIAEAILKGEVKLGGNRQEATVFFSDIRSFTAMSESMEAEQVVEMLNEYMTAMVSEIQKHQGVVDKYVGDAIMAVWGVPMPRPGDTWNAVRASLAMRKRLAEFNEAREKAGKVPVKIGMGLHTGELIAGNIGSTEKMEYTVIGDTVNTASRIESLTKEFGTDMLISEDVYKRVKDKLIVEPISANVKGKTKALVAYKVKGYYDEAGKQVMVETKYSTYEATHSDKVVHKTSA